ncbi:MAG: hypothetical protein H8M99_06260, partial [Gloeobacteraceae cyanobacterium ES-bin-144]|nr:hypothetical protein [Verrucomicrobiales bacterium]
MKLHIEDPRLTAYVLGELPVKEAAAVERAIAADPALLAAVQDLMKLQSLLNTSLTSGTHKLLPLQYEKIRHASESQSDSHSKITQISLRRWLIPLSAAAVITLIALALSQKQVSRNHAPLETAAVPTTEQRTNVKLLPAAGPIDPGHLNSPRGLADSKSSELPALRPRNYLAAATFPTLDLPVQSGKSSLHWIRQSILTKRELPNPNAVRLEEILNSFALRPNGQTVISRNSPANWHPDNRNNVTTSHAATIATEILACPWKPSASLILISIRGNPHNECEIKAVYRANPASISRYRLLGFSPIEGEDAAPLPTLLPANSSATLMIEAEPSSTSGLLGTIEWSVNGKSAPPIQLPRRADAEPSNDARFAALICTYALWLAKDPNAMIDTDVLSALA